MLVEKTLHEALIAYTKGKTVYIIQEYDDKSMDISNLADFLEDKGVRMLVDVAAVSNPEFEQAFDSMVHHEQVQIQEPESDPNTKAPESLNVVEENGQNFSGGAQK